MSNTEQPSRFLADEMEIEGNEPVTEERKRLFKEAIANIGNERSGNRGHAGRPTLVGGSAPGGGLPPINEKALFYDNIQDAIKENRVTHGESISIHVGAQLFNAGLTPYQAYDMGEHLQEFPAGTKEAAKQIGLHYFGSTNSMLLNQYLRGKYLAGYFDKAKIEEFTKTTAAMDKIIDVQAPMPPGLELYRGVGEMSGRYIADLEIGDTCSDKGFQSFSYNPNHSTYFAKSWGLPEDKGIEQRTVIRTITTGGEKAAYNDDENELVFKRGTSWKVIDKQVVRGEIRRVGLKRVIVKDGVRYAEKDTITTDIHVITVIKDGG